MIAGWRMRAKALLGTLVEISLPYSAEATFLRATNLAFSRIEAIHHAMSFHEATSDVRAIASAAVGDVIAVSADTWQTLLLAQAFERDSLGAFNATIAPELVARGLLPAPVAPLHPPSATSLASSIALEPLDRVRVLQPVWIDLGGIAKGYAVDAAVAALADAGAAAGVVNAGGDLRVFGSARHTLSLRIPSAPAANIDVAELKDLSCATSGGYFIDSGNTMASNAHPAIIGTRAASMSAAASVSVIAARCAVADALTKVLWLRGGEDPLCRALLARHSASAVLLGPGGAITRISGYGRPPVGCSPEKRSASGLY